MSRWRVTPTKEDLIVREHDYTAQFVAHNVDTGTAIMIEFTQGHGPGNPISDVIEGLRALAELLRRAATVDKGPGTDVEMLN